MSVRDEIVAYCRENVGCPYDWTPSGGVEGESYNCSYLTTCAYAAAGLEIPHWQGHQNGNGSQSDCVRETGHWTDDPDELLPGDLVFFSSSGDPYNTGHVGVSLGGWRMIDSVPDGGVQERTLYGSFVGGGWPLEWLPEDEPEPEPEPERKENDHMVAIVSVVDANTVVYVTDDHIHDLTHPDDIAALDRMWADTHDGERMPRAQRTADELARLWQGMSAGFPKHLAEHAAKFPPRS